jgi:integrase
MGKRDYAILLLLAVYGLRGNEVIGLQLEDCQWRANKLLIRNRKCGDELELPLAVEAARALVAYLRVRPTTKHREIFLSIFRPHPPLRAGALYAIATKAINHCGFKVAHPGSHTFRYSRAQALFAEQFSLPEIASALGHRDLRTTLGYLSFTVHPLRELALNAGEELA